jgi:hypothetical protein
VATGNSGGGGFGGGGGAGGTPLDANTAFVLVLVWMVGALLVAALYSERAEIAG